jgi:lipoyl(octanoyl) transferase
MSAPRLHVRWLDRVGYAEGLALQQALVEARRREACPDTLLLLEHPPVVTLGRSADPRHVLVDEPTLARRGIELHVTGRGGDVTYHGPGQLVGYPIVRLAGAERDAHRYLRALEQGLIRTAESYGVAAERVPGLTGVWVGRNKLAAVGVRFNVGWITSHGFALNVSTDLAGFGCIVPCGISDRGVTSLAALLGSAPGLSEVAGRVARQLAPALGRVPVEGVEVGCA